MAIIVSDILNVEAALASGARSADYLLCSTGTCRYTATGGGARATSSGCSLNYSITSCPSSAYSSVFSIATNCSGCRSLSAES